MDTSNGALEKPLVKDSGSDATTLEAHRQRLSSDSATLDDVGISQSNLIVTLLGYCIGVGNVVRFPYLVGKHGGKVFLLSYFVTLIFIALPLFYLELRWGQYTRKSTRYCYRTIHPMWNGLGWGTAFVLVVTQGYYSVLCGYALIYSVGSFESPMPWAERFVNNTAVNNGTGELEVNDELLYWKGVVLDEMPNPLTDFGMEGLNWRVVLSCLGTWIFLFLCKKRPLQSVGRVFRLVTILPLLVVFALFVRCAFLRNADTGMRAFFGIDTGTSFSQSFKAEAFLDALTHNFFSLSPGTGATITLASYSRRTTNMFTVAATVAFCDCAISLLSGLTLFSVVGSRNRQGNEQYVARAMSLGSGPEVAYVYGAAGFGDLEWPNFHSFLFFFPLFMMGVTTLLAWVETIITYTSDGLARIEIKAKRGAVAFIVCTVSFLLSLAFSTRGGFYLYQAVDRYAGGYSLLFVCFVECLFQFVWKGGVTNFGVIVLLSTLCPVGCLASLAYAVYDDVDKQPKEFPDASLAIGVSLLAIFLLCVLVSIVLYFNKSPSPLGMPSVTHTHDEEMEELLCRENLPPLPQSDVHCPAADPAKPSLGRVAFSSPTPAPLLAAVGRRSAAAGVGHDGSEYFLL